MSTASDYSSFGQVISPPDRPEPAHVEVRRLNYPAVLKKFGWTDATFDVAQTFGDKPGRSHAFPASMTRTSVARDGNEAGGARFEKVWFEDALDAWAAALATDVLSVLADRVRRR